MNVAWLLVRAGIASCAFALALAACGTDVDLGGTSDGGLGALDGSVSSLGGECAPCLVATDCASGVCAKLAGYLFCTTSCSSSAPCAADHTCTALLTPDGAKLQGCLPSATKCAPDNGPIGPDGAPLEHCGDDLDAPPVPSKCKACGTDTDACQPNGCYGGYWCNADKTDCVVPPKTCE